MTSYAHANSILEEIYDTKIKLNPDEVDEAVSIVNIVKLCMIYWFRKLDKLFDTLFKVRALLDGNLKSCLRKWFFKKMKQKGLD